MSKLEQVEAVAEKLRQEPYHFFGNDCIVKSYKLKRECARRGIPVRVVICVGIARANIFGWRRIPVIHAWGEAEGKRIETSRPMGAAGIRGIVPVNIKPVITVRF